VCRELGVSKATYHRWRNQFGGSKPRTPNGSKTSNARTPRSKGSGRCRTGESCAQRDRAGKLLGPERPRADVRHLQRLLGVSERFACRVTGQHRAMQRHEPASDTAQDPDAALRAWLRAYAPTPVIIRGAGSDRLITMPAATVGT
jgi:transposase-like protein